MAIAAPRLRWRARARLRRAGDSALLHGSHSELATWRASQLLSERHRTRLARSLHALVRELEGHTLPGASPVNRVAARPLAPELRSLAELVGDLRRPVGACGIVLLDELLTDGSGPLYARQRAPELRQALDDARRELG